MSLRNKEVIVSVDSFFDNCSSSGAISLVLLAVSSIFLRYPFFILRALRTTPNPLKAAGESQPKRW